MRKHGCQSRNHIDCDVDNELWRCVNCHRKFCYRDGGADDLPDYCDDCWSLAHRHEFPVEDDQNDLEPETWHEYPVVFRNSANAFSTGIAKFVVAKGEGYMWLGDAEGKIVGWMDGKQFDAIAKKWLFLRTAQGKKKEATRFDRLKKWRDKQLWKRLQEPINPSEE